MDKKNNLISCELIPYENYLGDKEFDLDKIIFDLDTKIDTLSNHADGIDYIVAIASGIACSLLDILWVGEFSLTEGREIASDKVDDFVKKTAKALGCKNADDMQSAVKFLSLIHILPLALGRRHIQNSSIKAAAAIIAINSVPIEGTM